jgi:BASS family bile acid:Na+ symporter
MSLLDAAAGALAWIGRRGTPALALSILVGILVPPLAALLKPILAETVFVLVTTSFLRVEPGAMRAELARPTRLLAATAWLIVVIPAAFGLGFQALGVEARMPGLMFALVLQAISPPLMGSPALAALLGLDAALSLAVVLTATLATPLTAPVFAHALLGAELKFSPAALGLKLVVFLAGAALIAAVVRRIAGAAWVARQTARIDGLSVVALCIFAVALMDGMAVRLLTQPLMVLALTAIASAIALGSMAVTALVFARLGRERACELGLTAGFRNMGLMVAAIADAVPEFTWLYFAAAQFPIYLLPYMLKILARRALPAPAHRDTRTANPGNP